jgi:hypothetical protein
MLLDKTPYQNGGNLELGASFMNWYTINATYLVSSNISILQKNSQTSFIITNSSLYFVY